MQPSLFFYLLCTRASIRAVLGRSQPLLRCLSGPASSALPCAQALLASLVPYRKDPQGAIWDNFQVLSPEPPVVLFRCTRTAWVMHHRDLADAAANPELFANERDPPTYHRYSASHSVRSLT